MGWKTSTGTQGSENFVQYGGTDHKGNTVSGELRTVGGVLTDTRQVTNEKNGSVNTYIDKTWDTSK